MRKKKTNRKLVFFPRPHLKSGKRTRTWFSRPLGDDLELVVPVEEVCHEGVVLDEGGGVEAPSQFAEVDDCRGNVVGEQGISVNVLLRALCRELKKSYGWCEA